MIRRRFMSLSRRHADLPPCFSLLLAASISDACCRPFARHATITTPSFHSPLILIMMPPLPPPPPRRLHSFSHTSTRLPPPSPMPAFACGSLLPRYDAHTIRALKICHDVFSPFFFFSLVFFFAATRERHTSHAAFALAPPPSFFAQPSLPLLRYFCFRAVSLLRHHRRYFAAASRAIVAFHFSPLPRPLPPSLIISPAFAPCAALSICCAICHSLLRAGALMPCRHCCCSYISRHHAAAVTIVDIRHSRRCYVCCFDAVDDAYTTPCHAAYTSAHASRYGARKITLLLWPTPAYTYTPRIRYVAPCLTLICLRARKYRHAPWREFVAHVIICHTTLLRAWFVCVTMPQTRCFFSMPIVTPLPCHALPYARHASLRAATPRRHAAATRHVDAIHLPTLPRLRITPCRYAVAILFAVTPLCLRVTHTARHAAATSLRAFALAPR